MNVTQKRFILIDPQLDHFFSIPIDSKLNNYHAKYSYLLSYDIWASLKVDLSYAFTSSIQQHQIDSWRSRNSLNKSARFYSLKEFTASPGICFAVSAKKLVNLYRNNYPAFQNILQLSESSVIIVFINHFMTISPYFVDAFKQIKRLALVCEKTPLSYSRYLKTAEVDLLQSSTIVELPYLPRQSLAEARLEHQRIEKCAIVGTSHPLDPSHPHVQRTGARSFSEIREILRRLHSQSKLDYTIFNYHGSIHSYKALAVINNNPLLKIFSRIRFIRVLVFKAAALVDSYLNQSYYNSFSMEKILSSHTMALCGEEDVLELPVIGFFEALMSGCIPLGSLHQYYESLGLHPNIHYIPYNGTYENARSVVKRILNDKSKIKKMQQNISDYSSKHFSPLSNILILSRKFFS
jgi:hypothetical protein